MARAEETRAGAPGGRPQAEGEAAEARRRIGSQIRERRRELGLTLDGLSQASGVAVANLSRLEGGGPARIDTYIRLASCLGLEMELVPRGGRSAAV